MIEERINKKDRPVLQYAIFQELHWQIWNILFQKSKRNLVTLFYTLGQMMLRIYHHEQSYIISSQR